MKAKLIFPSVDVIEYLTSESNPVGISLNTILLFSEFNVLIQRDPEHPHIPLLDFSKFENPDQEPQLKVVLNSTPTEVTFRDFLKTSYYTQFHVSVKSVRLHRQMHV